jgi:hypothetical protein
LNCLDLVKVTDIWNWIDSRKPSQSTYFPQTLEEDQPPNKTFHLRGHCDGS